VSQAILAAPAPIVAHRDLTERLRVDADFDARWAAWQSRGRSHDRAFHRKLLLLLPIAAVAAVIGCLLLIR
jgi:hypothetical protein